MVELEITIYRGVDCRTTLSWTRLLCFLTKIVVAILVTIGSVSARNDPRETKGIIYEVADSVISGTFVEITQRLELNLLMLATKHTRTKCLDSNY